MAKETCLMTRSFFDALQRGQLRFNKNFTDKTLTRKKDPDKEDPSRWRPSGCILFER